jgi:hypothetical protein
MKKTHHNLKFENILHNKLCKTEEFNLTVTRLENEEVKKHYPITKNDI